MWLLSLLSALQLAACGAVALWMVATAESWPSRLVAAFGAVVMLTMLAGAVAGIRAG